MGQSPKAATLPGERPISILIFDINRGVYRIHSNNMMRDFVKLDGPHGVLEHANKQLEDEQET